ncbi:MAG TPA: S-methyl-5-thioribose-1-phosphate isomerase [Gemmatimonadaceae bacterium]|nr:S-methyl-5-thioribose-1-phosphate isomerase [Gemmatimonadaceae bacterium]
MEIVQAVRWSDDGDGVRIIDQRQLPARETTRDLRTIDDVCEAIRTLAVRGAPAIGIAGAMGLVVSMRSSKDASTDVLVANLRVAGDRIRGTRPTAVNLGWALDRMLRVAAESTTAGAVDATDSATLIARLKREATDILDEDRAMCRRIGEHGATMIGDGARVLTHCNTGALATGGIGTALAAVYVAVEQGKRVEVFADETRPLLQGSRLTAWELTRAGIPVTVLVDGAAASLMRAGRVDLCIVGADRVATNGDVANKVGTYGLAIAAKHHGIPFVVAAPSTTFDPHTTRGEDILIEQRGADEVRCGFGVQTAPAAVDVYNPAFDVTPGHMITAIVNEHGIYNPPFNFSRVEPGHSVRADG